VNKSDLVFQVQATKLIIAMNPREGQVKRCYQFVGSLESSVASLFGTDQNCSQGGGNKSMDGLKIQDMPLEVFHVHFSTRTHGSSSVKPVGGPAAGPKAFYHYFIFCWEVRLVHLDKLCFLELRQVFIKIYFVVGFLKFKGTLCYLVRMKQEIVCFDRFHDSVET